MVNIAITSYDIGIPPMFKNVGGFPYLSPQEYQNILDNFNSWGITEFNIIGGEPSIHADFDEILKLTNKFANKNPKAKINIYTNGYNLSNYIHLLGLNTNIVLQWFENNSKTDSTTDKEILLTFKKLYELNYFTQRKAILEIPIGVVPADHSFVLALIKQYNIQTVQIRFSPLYEAYDNENKYKDLKKNFFDLCGQLTTKIIINPMDCIPWCQFSAEEKEFLKKKHITYPVSNEFHIIFYGKGFANTHLLDKQQYNYIGKDYKVIKQDIASLHSDTCKFDMCNNCNMLQKNKCAGRWGR